MPAPQSNGLIEGGARLDRDLFSRALFPCEMTMPVRFDEIDVLGHVNNAAAVAMMQEARIAFHHAMKLPRAGTGVRTVVGGLIVEFVQEITYPGTVTIGTGIVALGRTSYTFAQALRSEAGLAVLARTTMVMTSDQGPLPIPEDLAAPLQDRCLISR